MSENKFYVRLRLIIIKNGKLLVQFNSNKDYCFYVGGHLEKGETIIEGCKREIVEECGEGTSFKLSKILYIRDFFDPKRNNEQNMELFILGEINKFEELEKHLDPQHPEGYLWLTWLDMDFLPNNLLPTQLTHKLVKDYKNGFPNAGEYLGTLD